MKRVTTALAPLIAASAILAPLEGKQVDLTLFTPSSGLGVFIPADCSADGSIVLGSVPSSGAAGQGSALWTPGAAPIPLSIGANGLDGFGFELSRDGTVVAGTTDSGGPGNTFVLGRWTSAVGWEDIGTALGLFSFQVIGLSDDGQTIAGQDPVAGFQRWNALTGLTGYSGISPGAASRVFDISGDGDRAVGWNSVSGGLRAVVWDGAMVPTILPGPGGMPSASASAISRNGRFIVGRAEDPAGAGLVPVLWTDSVPMLLGPAPSGIDPAQVSPGAVSDDGRTVVVSAGAAGEYIWREGIGFESVEDLLNAGLIGGTAVVSNWSVNGLSGDGLTIYGGAFLPALANPFVGFVARLPRPEVGVPFCPGSPNSTGVPGRLIARGSTVVADGDVTLLASDLPPGQFGIYVTSRSQAPSVPLGGGQLCLGGTIGRFVGPGQIGQASSSGELALVLDLAALPQQSALASAQPGESWSFQAWHRDVIPGGSNSNLTSGLQITFD